MEERIKVAIAGFPSESAMAIAKLICQSDDMTLFEHGLSESFFANRHLQIACVYMEMYNQDRISLFFQQLARADVLIDCSENIQKSYFEKNECYEKVSIPVILLISSDIEEDKIMAEIRSSYQRDSCLRIV